MDEPDEFDRFDDYGEDEPPGKGCFIAIGSCIVLWGLITYWIFG